MFKKNSFFLRFLLFILFSSVYFLSRLQNLTSIPVFGDEAIYIRWSQIIKSVETLRFIPLTDGKQPFYMWIVAAIIKYFSYDPLFAGRLVSLMAGFGTLITLFLITTIVLNYKSKELNVIKFVSSSVKSYFNSGLLTVSLYIFIPFFFFFDRLALPDNLLSFFGALSILLSFLNAKYKRLDLSLLLGMSLGLAWLTKSPAIYFIVLSFLTFLIYNFKSLKLLVFPLISSLVSFLIYSVLRLGPQFQMIAIRNRDYVYSAFEVIKHPLDPLVPHLKDVFFIFKFYVSWPLILFFVLSIILLLVKKRKIIFNSQYVVLFFWFLLPVIANAAMAKVFTARYILYTIPPFIILLSLIIGQFLDSFKTFSYWIKYFLILPAILIANIIFMYHISFRPFDFSLPSTESGYLTDWTSGWGIKSVADYLIDRSRNYNVIVGTEGYFGTLPDGLQIYTNNVDHLTVFGVGLGFSQIPPKLIDAYNHGDDVYLLINRSRLNLNPQEISKLTLVLSLPKPQNDSLLLFKL